MSLILKVLYFELPLFKMSPILDFLYFGCPKFWMSPILNLLYIKSPLFWISPIFNVPNFRFPLFWTLQGYSLVLPGENEAQSSVPIQQVVCRAWKKITLWGLILGIPNENHKEKEKKIHFSADLPSKTPHRNLHWGTLAKLIGIVGSFVGLGFINFQLIPIILSYS